MAQETPARESSPEHSEDLEIMRRTYRLHVPGAICEGIFASSIWAASDVAAKNLGAQAFEVTLITMAPGVAQLISLFAGRLVDHAQPRSLFLVPSYLGRLPVLLLLFFGNLELFIVLLFVQALSTMPVTIALNAALRSNYTHGDRGKFYGRAAAWEHVFSGIVLFGFGFWLDSDPTAYRFFYPAVALLGIVGCTLFARFPAPRRGPIQGPSPGSMFMLRELFHDPLFFRFELAFFLYGIGFMSARTASPLFATSVLELENSWMLGAQALQNVMIVVAVPFMGLLITRLNPAGLAALGFGLLIPHAVCLSLAQGPIAYCTAWGIFGVAISGVGVCWNLGPVTLAPLGAAGRYMGIHIALVGLRALIGHPLGGIIAAQNPRWVFPISGVCFAVAMGIMLSIRAAASERIVQNELATDSSCR